MERMDARVRDISFRSQKNECIVTVHSSIARKLAAEFESDENIIRYHTDVPVHYEDGCIDTTGIRTSYLDDRWKSDFMVERVDGSLEIYEVTSPFLLTKKAIIEKYELSRRYWNSQNINGWTLCIVEEEETKW